MSQEEDSDSSYTLDDLANESGFDRRVIRSFIEQDLLRGPDTMGRYAKYSQSHLDRLLAIKALKNWQGLPLNEVRRAMLSMSHQDIQALAASSNAENIVFPPPPTVRQVVEPPEATSAADYIRALEQTQSHPPRNNPGLAQHIDRLYQNFPTGNKLPPRPPKATPIDKLLCDLTALTSTTKPRRQAKGNIWHHIAITPDIQLTVSGNLAPEELIKLELIADCIRAILMGG